jgi:hypothetical protein
MWAGLRERPDLGPDEANLALTVEVGQDCG